MSACAQCAQGRHDLCTGLDGPITTHPGSLPLCSCVHRGVGHACDPATTSCACGKRLWPEEHDAHLSEVAE